jgi:hypothetical protein
LLAAVGGDVDLEGGGGAGIFADVGQGFAGAEVAALGGREAALAMDGVGGAMGLPVAAVYSKATK